MAEASRMVQANDTESAIAKLEAAVALRPDLPQALFALAPLQASAGRGPDALATLDRLATMGLYVAIERTDEYAPLRSQPGFQALVKRFAANLHAQGPGEVAFLIPDVSGLLEGIAWRARTGEFLLGDAHARCVWARKKDGPLRRLTAEDDSLWGVYALVPDEEAGTLWAATAAVPLMRGFTPDLRGHAALAEIDLATGAVRRTLVARPGVGGAAEHLFANLALASDGTVYLTDSATPGIWRLPPGGGALEIWVESDEFMALQGIVARRDGTLVVADRMNGLLRVDPASRQVNRIEAPADTCLTEIEGLTTLADGRLIALQSGIRPTRVLGITLDPGAESVRSVQVLESGHLTMAAPSHGCLGEQGDFYFIGHAGRVRFAAEDGTPGKPRSVPIFKTRVTAGRR